MRNSTNQTVNPNPHNSNLTPPPPNLKSHISNLSPKRCAVYTRKSVEDGLEQDYNSLDAQRDAAENYIASQRANGWICLPEHYDDGGFSGGNLE